jgi:Protein DA1/LIM domain
MRVGSGGGGGGGGGKSHGRSSSNSGFGDDHEFLVRGGGGKYGGGGNGAGSASHPLHSRGGTDNNSQHSYARGGGGQQQPTTQRLTFSELKGELPVWRASSSLQDTGDDLELARKMQELEDRGMGRLNSDREIDIDVVFGNDASSVGSNDKSELAKLIAESGTSVHDIPTEVLKELLGTSDYAQITWQRNHDTRNSQPKAKKDLEALRASLVVVDKIEGPPIDSSKALKMAPNPPSSPMKTSSAQRIAPGIPAGIPSHIPDSIPDVGLSKPVAALQESATSAAAAASSKANRKKRLGFLSFANRSNSRDNLGADSHKAVVAAPPADAKPVPNVPGVGGIPAAIPPPPGGSLSMPARSSQQSRQVRSMSPTRGASATSGVPVGIPDGIRPRPTGTGHVRNNSFNGSFRGTNVCAACGLTHGSFLKAFDRKYHPACFRCKSCQGKIDPNDQFKYTVDEQGNKFPHHRECFMSFGVKCTVCRQPIPATPDGRVPYVKHPFFDSEQMCVRHAEERLRRCSGCQRFEPNDSPFIDLIDGDRCVCPACCRSVVVDSADVDPLWINVLSFFESYLKLPIWGSMRNIPIIVVGSESLTVQMQEQCCIHGSSTQPLASGLCLTERSRGPGSSRNEVVGVLCVTGLPRDLAAGVLAHEAAHVWMKLHPKYDLKNPLPPQVEEGICQLISMLFLTNGLGPPSRPDPSKASEGPTDEKLRQYFKFCIEREKDQIYGTGYRRAAMAYRDIGIEALLTHALQYRDFPHT